MAADTFKWELQQRVDRYRQAETHAAERVEEAEAELQKLRERRIAAETLYEAEFGERSPSTETASKALVASMEESAGPYTGLSWEPAIEEVLRDAGEPLHVREIWHRLAAGGFRTRTASPERSIASIAVRSPRLVKADPNTYSLVVVDGAPNQEVGIDA